MKILPRVYRMEMLTGYFEVNQRNWGKRWLTTMPIRMNERIVMVTSKLGKTTAKPNETKHESNGEKLESKETKSEKPTKHTTTGNPKAPTNGQISNVTPSQPSPKQTTSGSTNANDIPPISPKQPEKASKLNKQNWAFKIVFCINSRTFIYNSFNYY